jgi:hypothetical protein
VLWNFEKFLIGRDGRVAARDRGDRPRAGEGGVIATLHRLAKTMINRAGTGECPGT